MRMFLIFIPSIFYETLLSLPVVAAKIGFSTIQYSDSSDVECLKGDFLYKFNSSFSTTDFKLFLSMKKKKKNRNFQKKPTKKIKAKEKNIPQTNDCVSDPHRACANDVNVRRRALWPNHQKK